MLTGSEPADRPRVALREGRLVFNGREMTPFGGELQYFRVRDPHGDSRRTHEMWRETLQRMAKAGMNFLSTYVPWDWHAPEPAGHLWSGDRDLGAFLEMAHALRFVVCLKPGPYITAEWPEGFGTFGAVPAWFKQRHPETLVRRPDGGFWSFDPLGRRDQVQPRLDAPAFIDAVRQWFSALAPVVRPYIHSRPCVAMIQLDNETNLWWSDLSHVDLPGDYAGRLRHCVNYLAVLRDIWRDLEIDEPDVLFTANDSPFAIPLRHNLLQDAGLKSAVALPTLDTYPRGIPRRDIPADQPWQAAYFTRLLERHAPERFAFGAEIQGMDLKFAFGATAKARPEATGQLLASMFGSGLKGGALYVMREGLNADGTLYGPASSFAIHGDATARWEVASRFARWLREDGARLATARGGTEVAVVTHGAHQEDPSERGRLWSAEAPALFGWLRMAGFDPDALDLARATRAEVAACRVLVCIRPSLFPETVRAKLAAAADAGATVIEFGAGESPVLLGDLLPGAEDGIFDLPSAPAWCDWPGCRGWVRILRERRTLPPDEGSPFLRAADGTTLGVIAPAGAGRRVLFATRLASDFNLPAFYDLPDEELAARRAIARMLLSPLQPAVDALPVRIESWKRGRFVFVLNHGPACTARLGGVGAVRDAMTGEDRDAACLPMPEFGWAVLEERP